MRISATILARQFEVNADSVLEVLKKHTSRSIEVDDEVIVNPEEQQRLLLTLACISAKCHSCAREYSFDQKMCLCGKLLGRCPACQYYTSFILANKRLIGRNEYKCEKCNANVSECSSKSNKYCYQWAGKHGIDWLPMCPVCEDASPRPNSGPGGKPNQYWEAFWGGVGKGIEQIAESEFKNRKKK